jgi:hypothetical protein
MEEPVRAHFGGLFTVILASGGAALPALGAAPQECSQYAESAVKDYQTGTNSANAANCNIPSTARWQPSYQNHYNWCLTVPTGAFQAEKQAREDALVKCGARIKLDDHN